MLFFILSFSFLQLLYFCNGLNTVVLNVKIIDNLSLFIHLHMVMLPFICTMPVSDGSPHLPIIMCSVCNGTKVMFSAVPFSNKAAFSDRHSWLFKEGQGDISSWFSYICVFEHVAWSYLLYLKRRFNNNYKAIKDNFWKGWVLYIVCRNTTCGNLLSLKKS